MWHVYIIKSLGNEWFYVGSTNRLAERLCEHNNLKVKSTKPYAPLELVYSIIFNNEKNARSYERKLKDCRKEKEAVIRKIRNLNL